MMLARARGYRLAVEPYTAYGSDGWVRVLARMQMTPPPSRLLRRRTTRRRLFTRKPPRERAIRGWRAFTRIAASHTNAKVIIDGVEHIVPSDRGGVIDVNLPSTLSPGWQMIQLESADGFRTEAPVFVVDPTTQRVGIVSDVDDTVMVTALPRPLLAAWNTFVLDEHARTPTPGMNVLYERLLSQFGRSTTPVLYLSTGPWNVAPALARFLGRNLYPAGPLLLTDWGPTPERLFRSGFDHKVNNLERLTAEFPEMKWILVGDDGQHDEEIYGEFASRHPDRVLAVAIRRLSPSEAILAGGRVTQNAPRHTPREVPWLAASDGSGLVEAFRSAGLLSETPSVERAEHIREEFLQEVLSLEDAYDAHPTDASPSTAEDGSA